MKKEYKILLLGFLAITLLDSIGSITSRHYNFEYSNFASISALIYASTGFIITRIKNLKNGVFGAALVGLFDSTVGWKISVLFIANTPNIRLHPSLQAWIMMMIIVSMFAGSLGLIGGGLAKIQMWLSNRKQKKAPLNN